MTYSEIISVFPVT